MALVKFSNFNTDNQTNQEDTKLQGLSVYAESNEKIGTIDNLLVDEVTGQIRYLIVDLGFWIFGKKVLLPVGRARFDHQYERCYALGLDKEQAEQLPEFNNDLAIDYNYEENVRHVYHQGPFSTTAPATAPISDSRTEVWPHATQDSVQPSDNLKGDRNTYDYDCDPGLYAMNDQDHQLLKFYQERLIVDRNRAEQEAINKREDTQTAQSSISAETEQVIVIPSESNTTDIAPLSQHDFQEGEVARIEIFAEIPDVRKEVFVREEVSIRKEIDRTTVNVQETLRRETLEVNTQGHNIADQRS